jgi:activator of 2-hydroxyglutaryl-CoA dehydratase
VAAVEATAEEEIEAAIRIEIVTNKMLQLRVKRGLKKVEHLPQLNPSKAKREEEAIVDVVAGVDSEETMTVLMKTPVPIPSIETRAQPKGTSNISSSILARPLRDH